jgi:thioredoxin-dependent peroxiredoxin
VSFDTPAENKAFADKYTFNFPLLCDTDRKMGLAYGATAAGDTGGAKRVGCVIDPQGRIKEWLPKVDARAYPTEVLARL